jgi:hypothetical protein
MTPTAFAVAWMVVLASASTPVLAQEAVSANVRVQFESRQAVDGNPFGLRDSTRRVLAADARAQFAGPMESTIRTVVSARDESDGDGSAVLNELSVDRALGAGFVTVGKKVLSWDVGYAFRPLDLVQQQDRRAINAPTLEGVPLVAWEVFDATRALTVVLSNPGRRKADQPRDDGALALRLYHRNAEAARDEYVVMRLSDRNGIEGGVAFSQVEGEALELHGSVLLQQRHDKWISPLFAGLPAAGEPAPAAMPHWQSFDGGGKAMAGMTWTTEGKFSVLAEAWLDRTGASLRQRNVLLRASQNWDDTELSADVLWMPEDGGRVTSLALDWKHGQWNISASLRNYGGNAASMARASPVGRQAVVSINHAF